MPLERRNDVRNVAIIAHVDHGKTTLIDALLWQSRLFSEDEDVAARLRDSIDLERDKVVTLMPGHLSISYGGTRINIVNTPEHSVLGEEVERILNIVEGVLFLVDACEGPVPQTRFALRKALEASLIPLVVINKIDRPDCRPAEVLNEVRELFRDLEATEEQLAFPVIYSNAQKGLCRTDPDGEDQPLEPLFEQILQTIPGPQHDPAAPLQMLVATLGYDDYLGRLAIGRVFNGRIEKGRRIGHCRLDGETVPARIGGLFGHEGLRRVELGQAGPGEIVEVSGVESVLIGETLSDPDAPRALPPIKLGEPAISLLLSVNDSPVAGVDGRYVNSDKLHERLWRELLTNASIRVAETNSPEAFRLSGRGELQLVILIEMMRREGYEMSVGKPRVLTREVDGRLEEPMELLVVDCPEAFSAVVTQKVEARRGRLTKMVSHGTGRVRLEFRIPARGLIGFRSEFLTDTKGTGILNHQFDGYGSWQGEVPQRSTGSLIADRSGPCTAYAIEHLQHRGPIFVAPGDQVYEGTIVGENSGSNDLEVNITKNRPSNAPDATAAETVRLLPSRSMNLEQALDFIREDEVVEVTPRALRLRKAVLGSPKRRRDP